MPIAEMCPSAGVVHVCGGSHAVAVHVHVSITLLWAWHAHRKEGRVLCLLEEPHLLTYEGAYHT
jgi:hypothetical protein